MKSLSSFSIGLYVVLTSCYQLQPCNDYRKRFFEKYARMVVIDKGPQGNSFHVKGFDPIQMVNVDYADVDGLYNPLWNSLEIGDTLIKNRGNDTFYINKRSIIVLISYQCEREGAIRPDTIIR